MNYRNQKLLEAVRDLPCQHCGVQDGTVVAAHSNQLRDGKGRSIKASDAAIAALCYSCHSQIDQGPTLSRQERIDIWENAHRKTMRWLIEEGYLVVRSKM
jgi:Fe-S oxidoreductase